MNITELAEKVESEVNDNLGFDLKKALLISVTDGLFGVELSDPLESGDVYDLIESKASLELAKRSDFIAIVTCGWAAPLSNNTNDDDDKVAPSQHPDRKRVLLVAIVTDLMEMASAMRMNGEEVITTTEGAGLLADKLKETFTLAQIIAKYQNN